VELDGGASFVGWEVLCLGRPAAQERFERGSVRQRFEIWRDGVPRCLERMALPAGGAIAAARFGLAGEPVTATLLASPAPGPEGLARLRALCGGVTDGALACVTIIDDVAICRYLGGSAAEARALFVDAWAVLRPGLSGRAACSPRIWAT